MKVALGGSRSFDLGLTGPGDQDSFSVEKYRALAGGNPQGARLCGLVDEHWLEWLELVEEAPWTRNWLKSELSKPFDPATGRLMGAATPTGRLVDGARFPKRRIASAIYATAVWGYGLLTNDWLKTVKHADPKANHAMKALVKLQGLSAPNTTRTYLWDNKIYRGCGLLVPCEFGDLDRWLEPLWQEAISSK